MASFVDCCAMLFFVALCRVFVVVFTGVSTGVFVGVSTGVFTGVFSGVFVGVQPEVYFVVARMGAYSNCIQQACQRYHGLIS